MDQVQKSFNDIERKLTKMGKIREKGGSNLGMKDVMKMGQKGMSVEKIMKKIVKEGNNMNPTEIEAEKMLETMERITDLTCMQMQFALDNKPMFEKLHLAGMVKKNMGKSKQTGVALSVLLIEKSPVYLKPKAEKLEQRSQAQFAVTMAAFSNATGGEEKELQDDSD
ncbi:hypothetical protein BP5796_11393 [Coleophoma crateriformis]|uniref:Uncharacterized protein n=1 Tax=Coleophoma crateriformis TaxID=565419 RepID=A0A3D8QIE9_9HELO|nr:hypothetical protein BP5796_11393 [Coleophoma crateriformis]